MSANLLRCLSTVYSFVLWHGYEYMFSVQSVYSIECLSDVDSSNISSWFVSALYPHFIISFNLFHNTVSSPVYMQSVPSQIRMKVGVGVIEIHVLH